MREAPSRRDVAFRGRLPFTGPIQEAGHLITGQGSAGVHIDSRSLGRVCRPDWLAYYQVVVRGHDLVRLLAVYEPRPLPTLPV